MTGPRDGNWLHLDRRTVAASTIVVTGALVAAAVPVAVGMLLGGIGAWWVLLWTVGGVAVGAAATAVSEVVRLAVTGYRVGPHRVERRVRFLASTTTSLSTDRVRNVEISADLVQRRLGIATIKLASGETDGSRLTLAALDRATAEELRGRLLADRADADSSGLARLDPSWVRYAPASILTPLIGAISVGAVFQVADWFQAVPAMLEWIRDLVHAVPIPVIALALVLSALLIGAAGAIMVFVESWWGMRLDRHRDGTLELRRGLLVGRHTTFDGRRVRGVTLHEPPGFRAVRAARLDVVAVGTGSGKDEDGKPRPSPALLPASPRAVPAGVAGAILSEPVPASLRAHPVAARRRRRLRALLATLALAGAASVPLLVWPWLWWVPVAVAASTGAVSWWIAVDNHRGLGHSVTDRLVALRKGSVLRRTDVLLRDGVLGWNLRQTPFQKRSGLVTLVATSAGGSGAFRLPDVDVTDAPALYSSAGDVWEHLTAPE